MSQDRPFKCIMNGCNMSFNSREALQRHVNKHLDPTVASGSPLSSSTGQRHTHTKIAGKGIQVKKVSCFRMCPGTCPILCYHVPLTYSGCVPFCSISCPIEVSCFIPGRVPFCSIMSHWHILFCPVLSQDTSHFVIYHPRVSYLHFCFLWIQIIHVHLSSKFTWCCFVFTHNSLDAVFHSCW